MAFAKREELDGRFVDTSRDGFALALDISAYSLVALARAAAPLMAGGGSILTLTYYGAEKVVANYNVMGVAKAALEACVRYLAVDLGPSGIRVNAISAGPVRTLAASRRERLQDAPPPVPGHQPDALGDHHRGRSGDTALYLLSDMSRDGDRRGHLRRRRLQHHRRAQRRGLTAGDGLPASAVALDRPDTEETGGQGRGGGSDLGRRCEHGRGVARRLSDGR